MPEFNKARIFIKNVRKCGISMNSSEIDSVGSVRVRKKYLNGCRTQGTTLSDAGRARTEKVGLIHALTHTHHGLECVAALEVLRVVLIPPLEFSDAQPVLTGLVRLSL